MTCKHPLGVWADYEGKIHYKFDDINELYPVDVFKFCPECGTSLMCEHFFEPIKESYNPIDMTFKSKCIKCGFFK